MVYGVMMLWMPAEEFIFLCSALPGMLSYFWVKHYGIWILCYFKDWKIVSL